MAISQKVKLPKQEHLARLHVNLGVIFDYINLAIKKYETCRENFPCFIDLKLIIQRDSRTIAIKSLNDTFLSITCVKYSSVLKGLGWWKNL